MTDIRWLEDHVPNFLWAAGLLAGDADRGLFEIARVLDAVEEILGVDEAKAREPLDGGLVAFEAVPNDLRPTVVDGLKARGLAPIVASEGFQHALGMYPGAPGGWLVDVSPTKLDRVDPEAAETYLRRAIASIAAGSGPGGTAVKATSFRQLLMHDRLRFAADGLPVDELKRYPRVSPDERALVESFFRASFASFKAAIDPLQEERVAWAKRFWDANWGLYACRVRSDEGVVSVAEEEAEVSAAGPGAEVDIQTAEDGYGAQIAEIWGRFLVLSHQTDPGLYDPGRYEVLSGLAAHGIRLALAVAAHRGLWVGEFSAPLLRSVSEILIDLAWFATPEGRQPQSHNSFKEFGRGRLKLAKLHIEEFADRNAANPLLEEILEGLDEEVNREVGEEWQDISLEATFAGRDLRKMALASGSEWVYKLQLAPMSSIVHSEWPMLTRYAMELCVNPVHRLHWIPRTDLTPSVRPVAGRTAVVLAGQVLDAYRAALTNGEAEVADGPSPS